MELHPDFRDLLEAFVHCGVEFAIIGGYAVGHHAKPRATKDLDLLVSAMGNNLERVARALSEFGAPANVVDAARELAQDEVIYLGVAPVRIDILRSVDGIDAEAAIRRTVPLLLDGLSLPILALDDLIANKRAADRAQDRADVELLEQVRARKA